jgi:hypothetical protein
MKTLYIEGLANHGGPEPCVGRPRGRRRSVGRGTRRRDDRAAKFKSSGVPTLSAHAEGNISGSVIRELSANPARSENPCMCGVSGRENRDISWLPVVVMAGRAAQGRPRP